MVYRIYVERREGFDTEAQALLRDLRENLLIDGLSYVRILNRYDVEGVSREVFLAACPTVFSEPQTDVVSETFYAGEGDFVLAVEYLPGQFDQRADSCAQCVQLLTRGERPVVRTARVYIFGGNLPAEQRERIKSYIINPVECREASLELPETLSIPYEEPADIAVLEGFRTADPEEIVKKYGLAMDAADVQFCQAYFESEGRDPTMTELRVIDTYWSDHCRHTTFLTELKNIEVEDAYVKATLEDYFRRREEVYSGSPKKKPVSLMDIGTIAAKVLKKSGLLDNLDESDEVNACSIKVKVDVDGEEQDWLLMFKNETHNHPTEIEPFGGAATCLGGAIRDPLSGRAYVFQAMRVTGAGDPRTPVSETIPGKLPQSKLTVGAAQGYSSYGNQVGLATGLVVEIYHPRYVAKRMEIGAVVGAAPAENVVRRRPAPGDVVILLGGRTGRDGCGGATGSSKAHTAESLATCGAEVQKGNPPEERKLQRLFRNPEAARLIVRCNDFGAGGVSVAIGELADGLEVDLDKVPKKYEGLDGTELAISESQERMAVVVAAEDAERFCELAARENLEATVVAKVTAEPRMVMRWRGKVIVSLSREFLSSNGAPKFADAKIKRAGIEGIYEGVKAEKGAAEAFEAVLSDLNVCSQKGLVERFDSTIGAATVVMPFGGKYQLTPTQYMAAKLPVPGGKTDTASVMSFGFDPYISEKSPYHGAYCAVVESLARLAAAGVPWRRARLSFQEYFRRMGADPEGWGVPASALLGAYRAQIGLGVAAIGGKDSMSGTFEAPGMPRMDVPPTLVSFAVAPHKASKLITPEFKRPGVPVYLLEPELGEDVLPTERSVAEVFDEAYRLAESGAAEAMYAVGFGGVAEAVAKMCFGNMIGFRFEADMDAGALAKKRPGALIVASNKKPKMGVLLGHTAAESFIYCRGEEIPLTRLAEAWGAPLERVFPTKPKCEPELIKKAPPAITCTERHKVAPPAKFARPRVVIPVFPGTNCEYDSARAFEEAGGVPVICVLRNLTPQALEESLRELAKAIDEAQILMLPGGFSGGDEPDGSAKFITAVLRSPVICEAVTRLLDERLGLVLGICNGFQALIKCGLLPGGRILPALTPDSPTLTYNLIGRHQSMMVTTRVSSVKSPWMRYCEPGELYAIPISHGEGRFTAPAAVLQELIRNGQVATQYVDENGAPSMQTRYNPNGSDLAIEGIFSPDGRIFGKMGHSERYGDNIAKNVPGNKYQPIFKAGVDYYK